MSETNLELTETINENSEQVNAITEAGELKMLGATSALRMALTVDQTTAVIQRLDSENNTINLSFVTATASDILSGKVGADASGNPVYGSIATVKATLSGNVVTVPAGCIVTAQTLTVAEMAEPTVSGNAVTIPVGYNKTEKTVTIQSVGELTVDGNVVTIPPGYNPTQQTVTIPEAGELVVDGNVITVPVGYIKTPRTATVAEAQAPTTSGNVVTFGKGYNASEKKITVGTAEPAATITPGTADHVIPADTYLSGALTVKGDADLIAENIAEGVEIFGVQGTHKGGGMDFYKCAAVDTDNNTWSGYKAVLTDGVYSFESELTTGLTYSSIKPRKYGVYNTDATIEVEPLNMSYPTEGLCFFAPLEEDLDIADTGQKLNNSGVSVTSLNGVKCASFGGSAYLNPTPYALPIDHEYTVFLSVYPTADSSYILDIAKDAGSSNKLSIRIYQYSQFGVSGFNERIPITLNSWTNVTIKYTNSGGEIYFGKTLMQTTSSTWRLEPLGFRLGIKYNLGGDYFQGYMRNVLIYNRALSTAEIEQLADNFSIA